MPKGQPRTELELRGRKELFTDDDLPMLMDAVEESQGFKSKICKDLNISYPTLQKYLQRYPVLQERLDTINEENVDKVHKTMLERIEEGSHGSHILMMFYLKAKGGWRDSQHIIQENHNFDWKQELEKVKEKEDDSVIEGHFKEVPDNGWK